MDKIYDVIIVGSGPAGLTAAIYTSRDRLSTLILGGIKWGGQLLFTSVVENFPGFPEGIMGPKLMDNMLQQAKHFGAELKPLDVTMVEIDQAPYKLTTQNGEVYQAKSIILAQGASARMLGLPSEQNFFGKGVATCAVCDAPFYKDKVAAVIGGGDAAVEDALALTKFASQVYLIHRRDELRASEIMKEKILNNPKVKIYWDTEVKEVLGEAKVTGLQLHNKKDNTNSTIELDGMFLAIGHIPNTSFLKDKLALDKEGFLLIKNSVYTEKPGIVVAGDVADHTYQQAITAAATGCQAAIAIKRFLLEN